MNLEKRLIARAGNVCELCRSAGPLNFYELPPVSGKTDENTAAVCAACLAQIENRAEPDAAHWQQALADTIWSEHVPVKILSWRMLSRYQNESWAADLRDMIYLEDADLNFAKASGDHESAGADDLHRDNNGSLLKDGDTVVLTRSLDVKGAQMNAKMGTVVKNIRLVPENTGQIEGKIDGQTIIILTKYLRKQGA